MATKVAIEVDVKTGEASDDIIALREELEKVKQTQEKLSDQMKTDFNWWSPQVFGAYSYCGRGVPIYQGVVNEEPSSS